MIKKYPYIYKDFLHLKTFCLFYINITIVYRIIIITFKFNSMRKIILLSAAFVLCLVAQLKAENVWDGSIADAYAGGTGTTGDPYLISNGSELAKLAQDVNNGNTFSNVFFKLTADIVLNNRVIAENGELTKDSANLNVWIPIGDKVDQSSYLIFLGTFDGNGHEVRGLYVNSPEKEYGGLFGRTKGTIQNLGISDSYVNCSRCSGGICAESQGGSISDCYNNGIIKGTNVGGISNVGGIVGYASGCKIVNCHNAGQIIGYYTGGIGGNVSSSSINNCYNTGEINSIYRVGETSHCGGIVGSIDNNGTNSFNMLMGCFNKGSVKSSGQAGGIAGYSGSNIQNCYNEGTVEGLIAAGGISAYHGGYLLEGVYSISNCYNTGEVTNNNEQKYFTSGVYTGTGGIAGINTSKAIIQYCYNKGRVSGNIISGGIVGRNKSDYYMSHCYNTASVQGDSCIGGIIGFNETGTVTQCYNTGQVNGKFFVNNIIGSWYSGNVTYCYYLEDENKNIHGINGCDVAGMIEGFTVDEFKSGKVTWLLNERISKEGTSMWFQNIDKSESGMELDAYPVLDSTHGMVYATGECYNHVTGYSNTYTADIPAHAGENGICAYCGKVIPVEPSKVDDVYQIGSVGELYWFAGLVNGTLGGFGNHDVNASAVLTDNIIINEQVLDENGQLIDNAASLLQWEPIGSLYNCFSGSLDGQGHIICGIYCNAPEKDYQGLFGYLYNGKVSNLGLEDSYIAGLSCVGSLAGSLNNTEILNCYSTSMVNGLGGGIGGIAGHSEYIGASLYMSNCYFAGTVTGKVVETTGNIIGFSDFSESGISNCYYMSKPETAAGGINGGMDISNKIEGRTKKDFVTGEITWLLNNKKSTNTIWYQNISLSGMSKDELPKLDASHPTVYPVYNCPIDIAGYSNTEQTFIPDHKAEDGLCIYCGEIVCTEPELINDFYQISNAGELYWFAGLVNGTLEGVEKNNAANAVLVNDITINQLEFVEDMMGLTVRNSRFLWNPINNFIGTFDGNGHHIKGLYISKNSDKQGFFGYLNLAGGTIKNLSISESYIKGAQYVGGIVGYTRASDISFINCHNNSYITGTDCVGGIIGESSCKIEKCSNHGCIKGNEKVGGIAGLGGDSILVSYNSGTITGMNQVAGIAGELESVVNNCYNTNTVNGQSYVGGIVGNMRLANCEVLNSHNTGETIGTTALVGSIVGMSTSRTKVSNCYYMNTGNTVGGIKGNDVANQAEGRSAEEFANGTIYSLLNSEGNNGIWYQDVEKDMYPVLDFFVATGVRKLPQVSDKETVDVYDMKGYLIRKNVDKEKALNGLQAGIYIINNKKVVLEP